MSDIHQAHNLEDSSGNYKIFLLIVYTRQVQAAWGPLAGGHAGIAGSPRGQEMGLGDAIELANYVDELIQERILNDAGSGIETPETDGIEIEEYDEDFDDFEDR